MIGSFPEPERSRSCIQMMRFRRTGKKAQKCWYAKKREQDNLERSFSTYLALRGFPQIRGASHTKIQREKTVIFLLDSFKEKKVGICITLKE
jgi:hypothetical protein